MLFCPTPVVFCAHYGKSWRKTPQVLGACGAVVVALTGGGDVVEPSAVQRFDLADLAPANGDAVFA